MVTKTRAKPPRASSVKPVQLSKRDRAIVLECLALDERTGDTQRAIDAIGAIEGLLRVCNHRIAQIPDIPLASHVIAALDPIVSSARALVAQIDARTIQPVVLRSLGVSHDELWDLQTKIEQIATNAGEAIVRFGKVESDSPVAMTSAVLGAAEGALRDIFDHFRVDSDGDDPAELESARAEFVKQCHRYLPRAPMHSQRARKRRS